LKLSCQIKHILLCLSLLCCGLPSVFAQDGFALPANKKKDRVSFKLVNNLIIIPVTVNGTELSFLLDTGVNSTIIFSLTSEDSLEIKNTTPVKLRGLGEGEAVDALRSDFNTVVVGEAVDNAHSIFLIFDASLNFSPRMGVPIHGILGYDFYKNFIVKTNYVNEVITFYDPTKYSPKVCRRCEAFDLTLYRNKPYVNLDLVINSERINSTLLIDSGSSDALWLFDDEAFIQEEPKNYFEDYLGLGLSGGIYGKRSRIAEASLGNFKLKEINVAFPDEAAIQGARSYEDRVGSLGGNLLKRFTTIIDYPNRQIILKKNKYFNDPFHYDMSGLTIQHDGVTVVKERKSNSNRNMVGAESGAVSGIVESPSFTFNLAPKFVVAEVRVASPADEAGIKIGDEIISINNKKAQNYELYELIEMFSSRPNRKFTLEIGRDGQVLKKRIVLKKVL
jgi:hypothetical protein